MSNFRDLPGAAFRMDTQLEVTTVLANCGDNVGLASRAIRLWIESKQRKGRAETDIIAKVEGMERKYTFDASLHEAFHAARAETGLPRSKVLPPSRRVREAEERERQAAGGSPTTPTAPSITASGSHFPLPNSPVQLSSPHSFPTPSLTIGSSAPSSSLASPSLGGGHPHHKQEERTYTALQGEWHPSHPYPSQEMHMQMQAQARYSPESHLPYLRTPSPAPTGSTRRWSQGSYETITSGGMTDASESIYSFATGSTGSTGASGSSGASLEEEDGESVFRAYVSGGFPMTRTTAQTPRLREGGSPAVSLRARGFPLTRTGTSGLGRTRDGWGQAQAQAQQTQAPGQSEGERAQSRASEASSGSGTGTDESLRDWRAAVDLIEQFPSTPTSRAPPHPHPHEDGGVTPRPHPGRLQVRQQQARPDSPLITFSLPPAALSAAEQSSLARSPTTPTSTPTPSWVIPNPSPTSNAHPQVQGQPHAFGPRPRPPSGQRQLVSPLSPPGSHSRSSSSSSSAPSEKLHQGTSPVSPISPRIGGASTLQRQASGRLVNGKSPLHQSYPPAHNSGVGAGSDESFPSPSSPFPPAPGIAVSVQTSRTPTPNTATASPISPYTAVSASLASGYSPSTYTPSPSSYSGTAGSRLSAASAGSGSSGSGSGRHVMRHQVSRESVRSVDTLPPPAYSPIDPRLMDALGI
ncbi:hypothetical protein DACRYDRAFT_107815 [Dacryopinax primogenitus]|uniref:Uncharacterized protein n=1 Tax=Dacryopinax primogenitus (strain DJM 731) TaxID=1858805 RepID=M5FXP3_DACPD|nr:uncharacterized protein DACRYDRAFT_107815 [Dacryopinax primogenitus]EJU01259.1 hypothetical protein DACRYDRAFT_107815 [Dacryopinax primogenitus]